MKEMMMKFKHIIEAQQFGRGWLSLEFFPLVKHMEDIVMNRGSDYLHRKRMITFFYEASTRTRASFEIAMDMLGGKVVFSTENAREFSSVAKGETLKDTIMVLNRYKPDVIVLRYFEEGGAKMASEVSKASIINAGDGSGQHPTQALLDLYTIQKKLGHIDNISIAMVGDLFRGRTVRSLSYLLGKFSGIKIYFVSPDSLRIKNDIKDYLIRHGVFFAETKDLRIVAPMVDVVYQTRAQKERGTVDFSDESNGFFMVNKKLIDLMKSESIIMHPLPRNDEISLEVDEDPRAVYLTDQIDSGLYVRMALLKMMLS